MKPSKRSQQPATTQGRRLERVVIRKALVHGIANCTKCSWLEMDYNTVQRKALEHAQSTGHNVSVELGYAVTYFGYAELSDGTPKT